MAVKKPSTKKNIAKTESVPAVSEPAPEISLNDIQSVEKIISVATTRGAFRANEMTQVGQVYDKISKFLAWWAAKLAAENKDQTETKQEK